jgi:hypothetical protein
MICQQGFIGGLRLASLWVNGISGTIPRCFVISGHSLKLFSKKNAFPRLIYSYPRQKLSIVSPELTGKKGHILPQNDICRISGTPI